MHLVEEYDFEDGFLYINRTEMIDLDDNYNLLKNNIHHRIVTLQFAIHEVDLKFNSCSIAYDFVEEIQALCYQ